MSLMLSCSASCTRACSPGILSQSSNLEQSGSKNMVPPSGLYGNKRASLGLSEQTLLISPLDSGNNKEEIRDLSKGHGHLSRTSILSISFFCRLLKSLQVIRPLGMGTGEQQVGLKEVCAGECFQRCFQGDEFIRAEVSPHVNSTYWIFFKSHERIVSSYRNPVNTFIF